MKSLVRLALALGLIGLVCGTAPAAWTTVDTFESYTLGNSVVGQGTWAQNASSSLLPTFTTELDPAGGSNQVMKVANPGLDIANIYNNAAALTIAESATPATITFRIRIGADFVRRDLTPAVSHLATPWVHTNMKAYAVFTEQSPADPILMNINIKEGPAPPGTSSGPNVDRGDAVSDVWYTMWYVFHNQVTADAAATPGDTYDVYIQGGTYGSQTLLTSGAYYRGGNCIGSLLTFVVITDSQMVGYIDDLGVDTSGQNLTVLPEPATMGLLAVGVAGLLARRRKNRA